MCGVGGGGGGELNADVHRKHIILQTVELIPKISSSPEIIMWTGCNQDFKETN